MQDKTGRTVQYEIDFLEQLDDFTDKVIQANKYAIKGGTIRAVKSRLKKTNSSITRISGKVRG